MTDRSLEAVRGQRMLVTGGAGVIARDVLERLSSLGAEVLSVDRLPLPGARPDNVEHLVVDLACADLEPIVRFRPQHVLHLAASFERSFESPEFWSQSWSDNVVVTPGRGDPHRGGRRACRSRRRHGVGAFPRTLHGAASGEHALPRRARTR